MKHVKSAGFCMILGVAGLWASGVAIAQSASDSPLAFANADKNHDNFISRSEVPKDLQDLRSHFGQYDQNADHRLSEGEYGSYLVAVASGTCQREIQGTSNPNCGGASALEGNLVQRQGEAVRANQPVRPSRIGQGN